MKKPLIITSLILLTSPYSFAAPGQGLTSWDAQIEPVASSDLVGITDTSDTTQSDSGSSKKATMTQLGAFMATLFTSKTGSETIAGVKTFSSSPIVPTPTTDMQATNRKFVLDNVGTGTVNVVQTVEPTGSTSSAPSEAAVGVGLASKQNTADVQDVSVDVEELLGATDKTDIRDIIQVPHSSEIADLQTQINTIEIGTSVVSVPINSNSPCTTGTIAYSLVPLRKYECFANANWKYFDSTGLVDWDDETVEQGQLFYLDFNLTQVEDLAGGWTIIAPTGTVTTDSTVYGVLEGTESARVHNNAAEMNALVSPDFADASVIYYRALIQASATNTSGPFGFRFYNDTEGTLESQGYTHISSGFRATHGSAPTSDPTPFAAGVPHYVCGKFQIASGVGANDGQHIVSVSDTSNPANGSTISVTNGTGYLPVNRIYLAQYSSNAMLIDIAEASTEVIPECGNM
jgi:hypothetical protein